MNLKVFLNMEKHAFYILILSVLGIMWWIGISGIIYDAIDDIHHKYRIHKHILHASIIAFVLLVIWIHPQLLKSL